MFWNFKNMIVRLLLTGEDYIAATLTWSKGYIFQWSLFHCSDCSKKWNSTGFPVNTILNTNCLFMTSSSQGPRYQFCMLGSTVLLHLSIYYWISSSQVKSLWLVGDLPIRYNEKKPQVLKTLIYQHQLSPGTSRRTNPNLPSTGH